RTVAELVIAGEADRAAVADDEELVPGRPPRRDHGGQAFLGLENRGERDRRLSDDAIPEGGKMRQVLRLDGAKDHSIHQSPCGVVISALIALGPTTMEMRGSESGTSGRRRSAFGCAISSRRRRQPRSGKAVAG